MCFACQFMGLCLLHMSVYVLTSAIGQYYNVMLKFSCRDVLSWFLIVTYIVLYCACKHTHLEIFMHTIACCYASFTIFSSSACNKPVSLLISNVNCDWLMHYARINRSCLYIPFSLDSFSEVWWICKAPHCFKLRCCNGNESVTEFYSFVDWKLSGNLISFLLFIYTTLWDPEAAL